jgi:putative inorganic carbon (HCO3(-)) transporter
VQVHFTLPKLVVLRVGTLLLLILGLIRIKKGLVNPLPRTLLWSSLALAAWWILSTFFALHPYTALNGFHARYNGLWQHLNLLLLFLIAASTPINQQRLKRILFLFVGALIPVALYALLQYLGLDPIPWAIHYARWTSTVGNAVPLAALLGLGVPLCIVFAFLSPDWKRKLPWLIILGLLLVGMAVSLSRMPLIGTMVAGLLLVALMARDKGVSWKKIAGAGALAAFLVGGTIVLKVDHLGPLAGRLINPEDQVQSKSLSSRLNYYRAALEGVRDFPVFGVGFESFRLVYPRYRTVEDSRVFIDVIPSMVHNGYLQSALTNGIPALGLYLLFLFFIFREWFRAYRENKDRQYKFLLLALAASAGGFLLQDLTGWLEVGLTPFFWVLMGLGTALAWNPQQNQPLPSGWKNWGTALGVLLIVFMAWLSVDALKRLRADYLFRSVETRQDFEEWGLIQARINRGLGLVPDEADYCNQAGRIYVKKVSEIGGEGLYRQGALLLEKACALNPFDPYYLMHRTELDSDALKKGIIASPSNFSRVAQARLSALDPNNPTVYLTLARLRISEKKYQEALDLMAKAGKLDPDRPLPREDWIAAKRGIVQGMVRNKDYERSLNIAIEMVHKFPDNAASWVLMGNIYGAMADLVKAREAFLQALKVDPGNSVAKDGIARVQYFRGGKS